MIIPHSLAEKKVAILGLGRSGLFAAKALNRIGAKFVAWDDERKTRDQAKKHGVPIKNLIKFDFKKIDILILSPGIPLNFPAPHPVVKKAISAKCKIINEMDLLGENNQGSQFIGITGTNGKSTVTALLGKIFSNSRLNIQIGGNIGYPSLGLRKLGKNGVYILEVSSYQLELLSSIKFDIAILINISPDHISRHGSFRNYIKIKESIFKNQKDQDLAIIGIDDKFSYEIYKRLKKEKRQKVIPISKNKKIPGGVYSSKGWLINDVNLKKEKIIKIQRLKNITGSHNVQNVAAALAASWSSGINKKAILSSILKFKTLLHRQEIILEKNGITFINDSKATNIDSAVKALENYKNIFWIAGGQSKNENFRKIIPFLKNVKHAFFLGETSNQLHALLRKRLESIESDNLKKATAQAYNMAQEFLKDNKEKQASVLLSPACASLDQWKDFEERGNAFRKTVKELTK